MLNAIRSSHLQLKEGLAVGRNTLIPEGDFRHIVFAGMGGSSLAAQIIKDYVREEVSIDIIQDYELPIGLLREKTLFIAFSYSGNTEETIACLQRAHALEHLPIVVISGGGEMKEIAVNTGLVHFQLPEGTHPRCSLGHGLGVLLGIVEQTNMIPNQTSIVENTLRFMENRMSVIEERAEAFAKSLENYVPVFYSAPHCAALTQVMKVHMNENAKIQSFRGVFPEINHNEMVGYTKLLMKVKIVLLRSSYDTARMQERMHVMKDILMEEAGVPFEEIQIEGNSWLEEAYYMLVYAYFSSYFLAKIYGVNPKELRIVDLFKKRIKHA